jgi:fatty acid-binding protein DegV
LNRANFALCSKAARALEEGSDLAGAARRAQDVIPKVGIVAVIDTLEYLARGGRVPKVQAWASALLRVKPILELRQQVSPAHAPKRRRRPTSALLVQRGWRERPAPLCSAH